MGRASHDAGSLQTGLLLSSSVTARFCDTDFDRTFRYYLLFLKNEVIFV